MVGLSLSYLLISTDKRVVTGKKAQYLQY